MPLHERLPLSETDPQEVHALQDAIKSLKLSKPPRSLQDFWNLLRCLLIVITGLFATAFSFFVVRNSLLRLTIPVKNTLNSDIYLTRKAYYNPTLMWVDSEGKQKTGCHRYEKTLLNCVAEYKLDACREMQFHYCNYETLLNLINKVETFLFQKEFIVCCVAPGIMMTLHGLYKLLNTERERVRLTNSTLTKITLDEIKTIARQLKIDIAPNATIDDVITAFDAKLHALTHFRPSQTSQSWYRRQPSPAPSHDSLRNELLV